MPVDNEIYNAPGDIWWDERQPLHAIRTTFNPARMEYLRRILADHLIDPAGKVIVDVGCGGGLLAEELAGLGAAVVGIDPSPSSLATARAHAAAASLTIDYRQGKGEALPADSGSADVVCCVDVLEHVDDLAAVIGEIARVLKPGGLFLFDTINRTALSRFVMIKLCQEWKATAWMPPDLHDWRQFITPAELTAAMAERGLVPGEVTGLAPGLSPPALIRLMRQLKKGRLSFAEFGRRSHFVLAKTTKVSYIGYAVRN